MQRYELTFFFGRNIITILKAVKLTDLLNTFIFNLVFDILSLLWKMDCNRGVGVWRAQLRKEEVVTHSFKLWWRNL